jgi:hypothetical protein
MIITKTVAVPATTKEVEIKTVCDLCNKEIHNSLHNVDEVTIERKHGNNYGADGGNITTDSVDLCGECFDKNLVPWLKSQGVTIRSKECDW